MRLSKARHASEATPIKQVRAHGRKTLSLATEDGDKRPRVHDQYFSRAVGKALELLELLQMEAAPLHMNDIIRTLQISKTSGFRLLHTLEALGSVTMDARGRYAIAAGIHAVTPTQWLGKLHRAAAPHLRALLRDLNETASLAALFENRVEVIAVMESPLAIRMSNVVGHILPPNASSLGKAITAFQSNEVRERLLRSFGMHRFTEHTITDENDLVREYQSIREQGFAADKEEVFLEGICFSAPIYKRNGQVAAAASISMPKIRLRNAEHEASIVLAVRATAKQISSELQKY